MQSEKILSVRYVGVRPVGDISIDSKDHIFLGNGIAISNCKAHATAYGAITTIEMWLKYHFPTEYITALLNNAKLGKKNSSTDDEMVSFINYARRNGIEVLGPDVNKSGTEFTVENGKIRFSISHIKNVASDAETIVKNQPYASIADFHERAKAEYVSDEGKVTARRPNKKKIESLVSAGAFDCFGSRNDVARAYYDLRKKPAKKPRKAKEPLDGSELKPKKSEDVVPEHTDDEWVEIEKEMIGICLSQPPLYKLYEAQIVKERWKLICDTVASEIKRLYVFGQIKAIKPHVSKAGNSMYIVTITDGMDTMQFFVFQGGQQFFKDNYKIGYIGAIPLNKFDDGNTRFFDSNKECIVIKR